MKKILALVLAVVMALSLASVAFAVPAATVLVAGDLFRNGAAAGALNTLVSDATYYIPLSGLAGYNAANAAKYKVWEKDTVGKLASVSVVYAKGNGAAYDYCLAVKMPYGGTAGKDIACVLTVGKTSSNADMALTLEGTVAAAAGASSVTGIITGVDEDELDLYADGSFLFVVDTVGQGALDLTCNHTFNSAVAAKYDVGEHFDFYNFTKTPSFNRTGVVYLAAEEDMYVYEVKDGALVAIKGLKYDEDMGAFTWKTRTLGSYVVSDVEVAAASAAAAAPAAEKANPSTGR